MDRKMKSLMDRFSRYEQNVDLECSAVYEIYMLIEELCLGFG